MVRACCYDLGVLALSDAAASNRTTTVTWQLERSTAEHSNVYNFPFAETFNYNNGGIMYTTKPKRKFSMSCCELMFKAP